MIIECPYDSKEKVYELDELHDYGYQEIDCDFCKKKFVVVFEIVEIGIGEFLKRKKILKLF